MISTVKYEMEYCVRPHENQAAIYLPPFPPKLPVALPHEWPIIEAKSIGVGSMFLQVQTFIPDDFGDPATHVTGSERTVYTSVDSQDNNIAELHAFA